MIQNDAPQARTADIQAIRKRADPAPSIDPVAERWIVQQEFERGEMVNRPRNENARLALAPLRVD